VVGGDEGGKEMAHEEAAAAGAEYLRLSEIQRGVL